MNYLVIDDAPTMRRIVINTLAAFGFTSVIEASDGIDALRKLRDPDNKIDFIITDWNMPNMSGLELTLAIRNDPALKDLPILMVTTRGEKKDIVAALQAKVDNYVVKPFSPSTLKQKIDAVLASKLSG